MPRFSVVIQSYLGDYLHAASNRDTKIIRAIESVLNQNFQDFEIMVIADGCDRTYDMIFERYQLNDKVNCVLIKKQAIWSGTARNIGIEKSDGDYIVYLDIDDYFGTDHLQIIESEIKRHSNDIDWFCFDDLILNRDGSTEKRTVSVKNKFQSGTSNICHKRELKVKWGGNGYGLDDYHITQELLKKYERWAKIETPKYIVCHIPGRMDL